MVYKSGEEPEEHDVVTLEFNITDRENDRLLRKGEEATVLLVMDKYDVLAVEWGNTDVSYVGAELLSLKTRIKKADGV